MSRHPVRGRRLRRRVALLRKGQDPAFLKVFEKPQAGSNPVLAFRRGPVQVLADGLRQFLAAVVREQFYRFLDVGDLAPCETPAMKGGGLEGSDSRVHG